MSRIGLRHWLVALVIAVAVHAALLIRFRAEDTLTATNPGARGVRIALAPKQGKPKPKQAAADAGPKKTVENNTPPPDRKPEPEPETEPDPEPAPKSRPEPTEVPKPKAAPEPKQKSRPEPERKSSEPTPKPQPKSKSEPKTEPEKTQPVHKLEPTPSKTSRRENRTDNAKPADGQDRGSTSARAKQTGQRPREGNNGRVSDTPPDYRRALGAALQRHKNYPRRARRLGQEGTVVLYFVIDHSGQVLDWKIQKSSGHKLLDDAVRDMIREADPLPAMPDSVSMQRLAVVVPISFRLH